MPKQHLLDKGQISISTSSACCIIGNLSNKVHTLTLITLSLIKYHGNNKIAALQLLLHFSSQHQEKDSLPKENSQFGLLVATDSAWQHAIGYDGFPNLTMSLLNIIARRDASVLLLIGHVYPALDLIIFDRDCNDQLHLTFVQCKYTDKNSPLDLATVVKALKKTLKDWAPLVSSEKNSLLSAFKVLASNHYLNMTASNSKDKDWKPYDWDRAVEQANKDYKDLIASRTLSGLEEEVARALNLAGTNVHFVIVSFMSPQGDALQPFMKEGKEGLRILGKEQLRTMYGPVLYSRIQPVSAQHNSDEDEPDKTDEVASSNMDAKEAEEKPAVVEDLMTD